MNKGLAAAGILARLQKEAGIGDVAAKGIVGAGQAIQTAGRGASGAMKAWGQGSEAVGRSITNQLQQAGIGGARTKGALASGAMKVAPLAAGGYLGYKTFEPEIHSAKRRLGRALRGRLALYRARRRATKPRYHQGRFM